MPERPRGTVSFLFTDIAGSTALWERDGAAMATAVERHLQILREAIAAHGGVHFKTVGDAVQAAFATAPDALAAALDAQRALGHEDWGANGGLRVRMAVHAGEATPDDRGDYLAPALNRLSRLLAAGAGGQILVSETVRLLARGSLPRAAALRDLGEHRLRDLLEPERVYQLLHPDLPADFPALKSLGARPHNLPPQPTSLLGRERDVAQVVALLADGETRLVTLTGPGGTGKTRLAVQAAAELLDAFADGVFFVPLAPIADPELVPAAIAEALGIREEGSQSLRERLREFLAGKQRLLLLDNVEHVVAAAAELGKLLEASPGVKLLATSRVPLRLRAEREYAVPPLGLPPLAPLPPLDELAQFAAVRLFVERARDVRPDFALDQANAAAVVEICYRLDGLPLAIELAAARIRILSPQAMLARLEKRLPLLTGGARDVPARQRTLRDAIAWSYDLVEPAEQALFRRLAVFAGGFTLEAAEWVAGCGLRVAAAEPPTTHNPQPATQHLQSATFDLLSTLVEHSLVRQTDGAGDEPRFVLLETIREFGLEQLDAAQETDPTRQRHAVHFLNLAAGAAPELRSRAQRAWLDRLEVEHDNLRAALDWALAHDAGAALALAADLTWFWYYRGFVSEGRVWLDRALARELPPSPKRTAALLGGAALAEVQAAVDDMATLAAAALAAAQRDGDLAGEAYARLLLGFAARDRGNADAAKAQQEEALRLARQSGDRWTEAHSCINLAGIPWNHGDYAGTAALLEAGLAAAEAAGDPWLTNRARSVLGLLASDRGDPVRAIALLEPSLAQQRVGRDRIGAMSSLLWLGIARRQHGDPEQAEEHLEEALVTARELGDTWHVAASLAALGEVALARGDPTKALEYCRDAVRTATAARLTQSWQVRGLAAALVAAGRAEAGVRLLGAEAQVRHEAQEQLVPADRQGYDDQLRLARSALGDEGFETAWTAGRATPLEASIAAALDIAEDAIAAALRQREPVATSTVRPRPH